jgi:hypothetical protein
MECVSSSKKGTPGFEGRQNYFHFPELTTDDWDIYNQDHSKFLILLLYLLPSEPSKEVNTVNNLLDYYEEKDNMELGDHLKGFTK